MKKIYVFYGRVLEEFLHKLNKIRYSDLQKRVSITFFFILSGFYLQAQVNIFQLMERKDFKLQEIETIANTYFEEVGTGKGTGYKQYQRWLYERKFHTDQNGNYILPSVENEAYQTFISGQKKNKSSLKIWSELGPISWTRTKGWNPGVGRITSIAIHSSETNVIYVTSPGGGIWKSSNSGASWVPLLDQTNYTWMKVMCISVAPSDKNTLYAGLADGSVIKSTNAGSSWSETNSGPNDCRKIIIDPQDKNLVLVATRVGIYKSDDGGNNWTKTNSGNAEDLEFKPGNSQIVYASANTGNVSLWRSTNGGDSWQSLGSNEGITNSGRTMIGVSPNNPSVVYVIQSNGSEFGKLYKSTNSGVSFTTMITGDRNNGTNYFGYLTDGSGSGGQAYYDMAICVNPLNVNELHIAGIICWKSTNGGTSFIPETSWNYPNGLGYNHADVHALEFINGVIYSGSDGGIYKSTNAGGDWIDMSQGLGIKQVYRIACSKTNDNVIGLGAQDNGSSYRQASGIWVDWLGADGMDNIISPTDHNISIGTSQLGEIYKTVNSGSTFQTLSKPSNGSWITPLVMHPTNHDTVYGGWTGVYRSDNGGISWTNISENTITSTITCLAVAPGNTKYIYASVGSLLYATKNGGASWSSTNLPVNINSICVSPLNPEKIWLALNSGTTSVYMSTNMGETFSNISSGLPGLTARSIDVQDNAMEGLYVGMSIGVYYMDNVTPWISHGDGLPLVAINEVEVQKSSGKLRVATYGRGVWECELQNSVACNQPIGLYSSGISSRSATVSWDAIPAAISYTVEYKLQTSSYWLTVGTTDLNTMQIDSLFPGLDYDWRVRTNCSSGYSHFSTSTISTTCDEPDVLHADGVVYDGVDLSWTPVPGAVAYEVQYKRSKENNWTTAPETKMPEIQLGDLASGEIYDWKVSSKCVVSQSGFETDQFITLCVEPTNPWVDNIDEDEATVHWNHVNGAVKYFVEYRLVNDNYWNVLTTTDSFYRITGLNVGRYQWRVGTTCAVGNQGYLNSEFITHCHSAATYQSKLYIRKFKLNEIERESKSDDGYYSSMTSGTFITPLHTYTMTFAAGFSENSEKEKGSWSFFIDYDRNGYLNDKDEIIANYYSEDSLEHSINFTVPHHIIEGTTKLRVALKWGTNSSKHCQYFYMGEVEDYLIDLSFDPLRAVPGTISNLEKMSIYPVPVKETFNLNYTLDHSSEKVNTVIVDALGKQYYNKTDAQNQGSQNKTFNVAGYPNGIYFITVKTERGMQVQRFSINN